MKKLCISQTTGLRGQSEISSCFELNLNQNIKMCNLKFQVTMNICQFTNLRTKTKNLRHTLQNFYQHLISSSNMEKFRPFSHDFIQNSFEKLSKMSLNIEVLILLNSNIKILCEYAMFASCYSALYSVNIQKMRTYNEWFLRKRKKPLKNVPYGAFINKT